MGHGHHHHHHPRTSKNILIAFGLNFSFAIIEIIGGIFTNSVAITSDAIHDLGDSLALLFSYFAEKYSHKKPDEKFNFGYRRFSLLAGVINGGILFLGSLYILSEAFTRLQNPEVVYVPGMIALAFLGIAVNGFAAFRLKNEHGLNAKMVTLHLFEDMLGWIAVLVVSIILLFKPWYILDAVLSVMIALYILKNVYSNLKSIAKILLQGFPDEIPVDEIEKYIKNFSEVVNLHLIKGWAMDEHHFNLTLHIQVKLETTVFELDRLREKIEAYLKEKHIMDTTIQFEGADCRLNVLNDHPKDHAHS